VAKAGLTSLPKASALESLRLTAGAMLPNLVQGLFRRRPRAVAAISAIRGRHGAGPVWVKAGKDEMLLVHSTDDVRRVLEGSPHPFASDPDAKRRGMSHFQPDALTISRGELWQNRRRFAESVLDSGRPRHRHADTVLAATGEEVAELLREVDGAGGELEWGPFNRTGHRIARRVIFGASARDDEQLSALLAKLMDEANKLPDEPSPDLDTFLGKVAGYVSAAEEGSLMALFGEAPSDESTRVERQATHWLFALADTLPANAFRALALLATHPAERERAEADPDYLDACIQEAMRLWPTTPLLSRETVEETDWDGAPVPAGTQILISNTFDHRDPERHGRDADRFDPEAWISCGRDEDWSLNQFSHGPQGCPGAGLAMLVGRTVLGSLLSQRSVHLLEPGLNPTRPLPHMLDFFRLRFALGPRPRSGG